MVIDFHSHILPYVDDGAKDMDTALAMIEVCRKDGVTDIVSTSHCYPQSESDIDEFAAIRDKSFEKLSAIAEGVRIHKGCEVHLTGDLTRFSNIKKLCIENADYMLLEMPVKEWTDEVVDNVYKLTLMGITPIIAHHERNNHQKKGVAMSLLDLDVLVQVNFQSLWDGAFKKDINSLMKSGMVHIVGTDMHNLTSRKPCLGKGRKVIEKRYGKEAWDYLMKNGAKVLENKEISYREFRAFKKKTLF